MGPNFTIILDALFRLSLEFSSCTSHVAGFVVNHQLLCVGPTKEKTLKWIRSMLRTHLPHGHDFEIAWCLVICGVLKFPLDKDDLPPTSSMPNAIVFAMLGLLHERGLLKVPLSAWPWRAYLKKQGVYGEGWLPFFEAVRHKWTKDKKMINAINSDQILSKMLAARVSFLEDQIFEAKNVDLTRRVFSTVAIPIVARTAKSKVFGFGGIVVEPSDFDY